MGPDGCRCGMQRCICSHRKRRPPRFLPFKEKDRVVLCPHKTSCMERGRTGTIDIVQNHLEVSMSLDAGVSPFRQTEKCEPRPVKTYMLRQASECHDCIFRMGHMQGAYCPADHKEIVFYEDEEGEAPSEHGAV